MNTSKRIHSYDFFQGVLATGLIFVMTFLQLNFLELEIFYRWAGLGFVFFSGLLIGEVFIKNKSHLFFIKRGIQIFALFLTINFLIFFSKFSLNFSQILEIPDLWKDFSFSVIKGDYRLISHLLLPLSLLFFSVPILRYIPSFLGFFWAILGFVLFDIIALEKGVFYINIFFLLAGILGFFTGRFFSLDRARLYFHKKFSALPYIFLYIAIAILTLGNTIESSFIAHFNFFWSFHFLVMILLYLSLPSLLFSGEKRKPALRKFFETLGVEMLFIYIFTTLSLEAISFLFPSLSGFHPFILAIHLVILSFGIVVIIRKTLFKSKKFKKCFRFLF